MAVAPRASIEEVGEIFAETVRNDDTIQAAWVSSQYGSYDVWILIEAVDLAAERGFYALVDPLYGHFPETTFSLHVLNPRMFDALTPETIVPAEAHRIELRASA